MKDAIYFGTFAPMHKGHLYVIDQLLNKYQKIYIVVSGYTNDRGDDINIPLDLRYKTIKKMFEKQKRIKVIIINEDQITKYPNGWDQWLCLISEEVDNIINYTFITSEDNYQEELNIRGYKVDKFNRQDLIISGTQIRSNPSLYSDYIADLFKPFFDNV